MTLLRRTFDALSYPRGVLLTILGGLWTLFMSVVVLATAALVRHRRAVDFTIDYLWAWPIVFFSGVRVDVRGREHVRADGPGSILLFNHGSLFDILVLYLHYPRTFRFGAKIELFKIPFFGTAMRLVGVLPIDRRNRTRVMQIYEAAEGRVRAGESFALAPEGTRQVEPKLGPFKRGPFEFAINAGADLQPVVIAGAQEVLPPKGVWINQGKWRRRLILDIAPPISTAGLETEDAQRLASEAHADMSRRFERARAELGYA
jgi:1-acyl-sn-glycerol-3-phosphate acyltransferase